GRFLDERAHAHAVFGNLPRLALEPLIDFRLGVRLAAVHVLRHLGMRHQRRESRTVVRLPRSNDETFGLDEEHEARYFLSFFGFLVSFFRALFPLAMTSSSGFFVTRNGNAEQERIMKSDRACARRFRFFFC